MKMTACRKDNKGFSLVEVLVAITVLALVIAPIAALFTSSVRMNMVSKLRMNALVLAEDLMEGIKANDIGELSFQFNNPDKFTLLDPAVMDGATPQADYDGLDYQKDDDDNIIGYTFSPNDTGVYEYKLSNVEIQKGKDRYDAVVTVDASSAKYANVVAGTSDQLTKVDYNAAKLVEVAAIKGDANMSGMVTAAMDEEARTALEDFAMSASPSHHVNQDNVIRTFTIQITDKNTAAINLEYKDTELIYNVKNVTLNTFDATSTDSKEPLKNVFLFYTPNYNSRHGGILDRIQIVNQNKVDVNVYIVKQEIAMAGNPPALSEITALKDSENIYKADVVVYDDSAITPHTRILTNLDYNLAHEYDATVDEAVSNQASYYVFVSGVLYPATAGTPLRKTLVTDLSDTTVKQRFFDVKIDVYRAGDTADPIYTLTGSTQE